MALLLILPLTFLLALLAIRLFKKKFDYMLSGRIAMSVLLIFTGIGHFIYTEGMSLMIPDFIPYKKQWVYVTGVIEMLAAVGLLIPRLQFITACLLIIFFILILPANISAALRNIDFLNANNSGPGTEYLWFRIPLQMVFILWIYWFGIRKKG